MPRNAARSASTTVRLSGLRLELGSFCRGGQLCGLGQAVRYIFFFGRGLTGDVRPNRSIMVLSLI